VTTHLGYCFSGLDLGSLSLFLLFFSFHYLICFSWQQEGVRKLNGALVVGALRCLLGSGSFHFVPCFPLFWVLWLNYGWQGFIIISHYAGCFVLWSLPGMSTIDTYIIFFQIYHNFINNFSSRHQGGGADTLKFNLHIIGRAKKGCEFNQKRCEFKILLY